MNSKELVKRAIKGDQISHPACGPLATFFCASDSGVLLREFSLSADVQVDCILRYYEKYRPDAVWISTDTWVTAEAMGAPVFSPLGDQPLTGSPEGFIDTARDLDRIPSPDPYSRGRQPLQLEVLTRVVEALGKDTFVVGCFDQSPFSLACQALGITSLMTRIIEDRSYVADLLEKCLEHSFAYAEAMAACGVDMLSTGDSPAGLLGPDLYSSVALPWEQKLSSRLSERTDTVLSLHICGDTESILPSMAGSGAHVLEIDHLVDIGDAFTLLGDQIALWGNIDPVRVLLNGNTSDVRDAVTGLLNAVESAPGCRFVLSSGCILAPETPPQNLQALFSAARA
ncbi:MAG: uroporphyrinogen decarboxylase family protein [Candidatus Aminicenantaceae bacterium]